MSIIISVSGMIGAGKTTFIENYSQYVRDVYHIPVARYLEPVEDNKLLSLMYEQPDRWMFTSQVNFLVDKMRSLKKAQNNTETIILVERDFLEQLIFIEAQFSYGTISEHEYRVYKDLYESVKELLPKVVNYHIFTDYETSISHIRNRGRACEQIIDERYYQILLGKYNKFYMDHPEHLIIRDSLDINEYERITRDILREVN